MRATACPSDETIVAFLVMVVSFVVGMLSPAREGQSRWAHP